jgi:transcription termination/antitermination protein NusG
VWKRETDGGNDVLTKKKVLWYALAVEPGKDESVRANINRARKAFNMEKCVRKVVCASRYTPEVVDGKRVLKKELLFPGYLIIQAEYSSEVFHFLQTIRDCLGLLPRHEKPTALKTEEAVRLLLEQQGHNRDRKEMKAYKQYACGQAVKVMTGVFVGYEGKVLYNSQTEGQKDPEVVVRVEFLGTPTVLTLKHWEVKPCA